MAKPRALPGQVNALADYVRANGGQGMMLWSLQKAPPPDGGYATAQQMCTAICVRLQLGACNLLC